MSLVLDNELLQTIGIVEKVTQARIDKCIPREDRLVFVVERGDARKIVGPSGATLKKLEEKLGKRLKIIEKTPDKFQFVKNAMLPLKVESIKEEAGIIVVHGADEKTRGLMIGAKARNLRFTESVVQMYFPDVVEIKVV
jgi:N utilization substance protein A